VVFWGDGVNLKAPNASRYIMQIIFEKCKQKMQARRGSVKGRLRVLIPN
jgi:hypothetical protein